MAQYYTKNERYEGAIQLYEDSFNKDKKRPRYSDALLGKIDIYDILGDIDKEIETYDRLLKLYKEEWKMSEDEATYLDALEKKNRLINSKGGSSKRLRRGMRRHRHLLSATRSACHIIHLNRRIAQLGDFSFA